MFQGLHESLMKNVCAKLGEIVFTFHVNEKGMVNTIIFYQNQQVNIYYLQFSSVAQSCPTLCDPMNRSTRDLPVHHQLWSLLKPMSIESVMPSSHLILCHPLLLLPPIPPSILLCYYLIHA